MVRRGRGRGQGERQGLPVIQCLKAGVNLIDSSHWYGQGRSERLLGRALKEVPRKAYYINTKIGRYDKDPLKMFDFSYAKTYQGVLDSLGRLGIDCVDSMQVQPTRDLPRAAHPRDPPRDPPRARRPACSLLPIAGARSGVLPERGHSRRADAAALARAKAEGKIRLIGMTGYPLGVQQEIITRFAGIDTSLSYCHYSLNDTSLLASGFIDFCASRGMALINASPISMGLLMDRDPPDWHPRAPPPRRCARRPSPTAASEASTSPSSRSTHPPRGAAAALAVVASPPPRPRPRPLPSCRRRTDARFRRGLAASSPCAGTHRTADQQHLDATQRPTAAVARLEAEEAGDQCARTSLSRTASSVGGREIALTGRPSAEALDRAHLHRGEEAALTRRAGQPISAPTPETLPRRAPY